MGRVPKYMVMTHCIRVVLLVMVHPECSMASLCCPGVFAAGRCDGGPQGNAPGPVPAQHD
jgi:hypothetical protein